jgi:DNA-binding NtrC family response regulator
MAGRVIVHSRSPQSGEQLLQAVSRQGYDAQRASDLDTLQQLLVQGNVAACVLDEPPSSEFVESLGAWIRQQGFVTQLIVLPALSARNAPTSVRLPADVLEPPHTPDRIGRALFAAVGRARLLAENLQLKQDLDGKLMPDLIGHSAAMQRLRNELRNLADDPRPVLVTGDAGSGVTFIARAVHGVRQGDRQPLVTVRCSVLSAAAAEEILFGRSDAAPEESRGRVLSATGGTLLLDDVDALALSVQSALASALSRISAAAGSKLQVIATTHADLRQKVARREFDGNLLACLSVQTLIVPSLRERRPDIAPLAEHFLAEHAAREGLPPKQLSTDSIACLNSYPWPGNVRELENVISRCCTLDTGAVLTAAMISPWLEGECAAGAEVYGLSLREMERKLIEATFNRFSGNRELTARALKIGLRTLSGKLREYGYPPRGGPGSNRQVRAA